MKAAALISLVLLCACTSTPTRPGGQEPGEELTTDRFWQDQKTRALEAAQISAKVHLSYQGKRQKVSGLGRIVTQPEKLRLELRDPLGRIHYLAVLNGSQFTAHYPRQKLAYQDQKFGGAYVLDFLGIDFTFAELHTLLLGILPERLGRRFETWYRDTSDGLYRGILTSGSYRVSAAVDPNTAALKALELASASGKILIAYSAFQPCCHGISSSSSVRVAQVVDLKLDRAKTALAIEWDKISPLEEQRPDDVYRIEVPEQDQKIVLK